MLRPLRAGSDRAAILTIATLAGKAANHCWQISFWVKLKRTIISPAANEPASILLMLELNEQNAAKILHSRGHLTDPRTTKVRELSGGVSNAVFLIEQGSERFVVKQARGKLRVQADWQCSVERIWREVEVLRTCNDLIPKISPSEWVGTRVPELLWTNRELFAYAMTAADVDSHTWKERLLAGDMSRGNSQLAGDLLGRIHAKSWHEPFIETKFEDRTFFAELRLQPYYLAAAQRYTKLAFELNRLADETWRQRHALVHGDFSPKNLLVSPGEFMLIDFEVGHYGDPAFDLGFLLTHLTLKAIHLVTHRESMLQLIAEFWRGYSLQLKAKRIKQQISNAEFEALEHRTIQHLAGCLVARVHGKSPVDYLAPSEQLRAVALAEKLFGLGAEASWSNAYQLLLQEV